MPGKEELPKKGDMFFNSLGWVIVGLLAITYPIFWPFRKIQEMKKRQKATPKP